MAGGSKNSLGYKMENNTIFEMPESHSLCINIVTGELCSLIRLFQVK